MISLAIEPPPDTRALWIHQFGANAFGVTLSINRSRGCALVLWQNGTQGEIPLGIVEHGEKALEPMQAY